METRYLSRQYHGGEHKTFKLHIAQSGNPGVDCVNPMNELLILLPVPGFLVPPQILLFYGRSDV